MKGMGIRLQAGARRWMLATLVLCICSAQAGLPQACSVPSVDPTEADAHKFINGYTDTVYTKMRDVSSSLPRSCSNLLSICSIKGIPFASRMSTALRLIGEQSRQPPNLHLNPWIPPFYNSPFNTLWLQALTPGKVVLDIGTGALALLAVMAARSGASKVYAIEANKEAFDKAVVEIKSQGLADVIEVFHGHSTHIELPTKVDMVVHEILGEIASIEGAARVIRDAHRRHLKATRWTLNTQSRRSIPASASSWICPCEMPDSSYWESLPFPVILPPDAKTLKLWRFPKRQLLSEEWLEMEKLEFESEDGLASPVLKVLEFPVYKEGTFAGFVIRMHASLLEDGAEEIKTWCWDEEAEKESCQGHWAQQVIIFPPAEVLVGDKISVTVDIDTSLLQPRYSFAATLQRQIGTKQPTLRDTAIIDLGKCVLEQPNFG